ncbi:MAG: hypothetical protein C4563_00375 [Desulfobulbus sp.]|jgi:predicted CXXCH cytochrome family protein|nr:MAG: hypothetical protein C4563_00375 [Desulfobulbus sp.]
MEENHMRKVLGTKLALAGAVGLVAALAAGSAGAAVCSSCHTMHNSQNGTTFPGALAAPQQKLLLNTCIGCHTGTNTSASLTSAQPEVMGDVLPTYSTPAVDGNTLAGGNFWWSTVAGSENTGHNVAELGVTDPNFANPLIPPGGSALGAQLTCAGTNGCHGDRTVADSMTAMQGAHHAPHNIVTDTLIDGLTVGTSFRYLLGVTGREDGRWEFDNDDTLHNIYKGVDRTGSTDLTNADPSTINSLCGQCHGAFHRQSDAYGIVDNSNNNIIAKTAVAGTLWIRHPTDYDMPLLATTEYAGYNAYRIETPVGTATPAGTIDVGAADSRIVLCVSCHRAHGSPYADALRWDYSLMETGNPAAADVGTGCFACHTAKD